MCHCMGPDFHAHGPNRLELVATHDWKLVVTHGDVERSEHTILRQQCRQTNIQRVAIVPAGGHKSCRFVTDAAWHANRRFHHPAHLSCRLHVYRRGGLRTRDLPRCANGRFALRHSRRGRPMAELGYKHVVHTAAVPARRMDKLPLMSLSVTRDLLIGHQRQHDGHDALLFASGATSQHSSDVRSAGLVSDRAQLGQLVSAARQHLVCCARHTDPCTIFRRSTRLFYTASRMVTKALL